MINLQAFAAYLKKSLHNTCIQKIRNTAKSMAYLISYVCLAKIAKITRTLNISKRGCKNISIAAKS